MREKILIIYFSLTLIKPMIANMEMNNKRFMCGEVKAELETNIDGSKTIKKIVKSK